MTSLAQATRSHTLVLPFVADATQGFVYCDDMQRAVSLALAAGVNLIFSGPGGHAKSEFLSAVFGAISGQDPYIKSFGQGTSVEELFGGIDFGAFNRADDPRLQYNPDLSFLREPLAIFEELFDAPPRVLTALKDTLTARALRNGHQRYKMRTRVIAAATNHSPQDIAAAGPEVEALIQRFPIQLEVKWPKYGKDNFAALFATVLDRKEAVDATVTWADIDQLQQRAENVKVSRGMLSMLAYVLFELKSDKVPMSPRTAMYALQLVKAAAAINGRGHAIPADAYAVAFLPGALRLRERLGHLIEEAADAVEAEERLHQAQDVLNDLTARFNQPDVTNEALEQIAREAIQLSDALSVLPANADQAGWRRAMHDAASSLATEAHDVVGRAEIANLLKVYATLDGKLESLTSVSDYEQFCGEVRALIRAAMAVKAKGMISKDQINQIVNDGQALQQLAESELQKASQNANVDELRLSLERRKTAVDEIYRKIRRERSQSVADGLLRETDAIEAELNKLLIHSDLTSLHDATRVVIGVIRSTYNSRFRRV